LDARSILPQLPSPPLETDTPRYVFAAGIIRSASILEQAPQDMIESLSVNMLSVVMLCDHILVTQPRARICIIGSESAYRGSYDTVYALAKAGVHAYVRWRKIGSLQQLVAVAPSIIADAGMTVRRKDQDRVEARRQEHPKLRHITSAEVASMIRWLLYEDRGYTTGTIIEMAGRPHNGR
jgi:NAD(P)-dependent dehydrogenase (short-subunit alcohol dehydrogenase family)